MIITTEQLEDLARAMGCTSELTSVPYSTSLVTVWSDAQFSPMDDPDCTPEFASVVMAWLRERGINHRVEWLYGFRYYVALVSSCHGEDSDWPTALLTATHAAVTGETNAPR